MANAVTPPRTRINWGAARARYVALDRHERTYARIAAEFGVSDVSVRKWARREGWAALAASEDAKSANTHLRHAVKTRDARVAATLRIVDGVLDSFVDDLDARAREAKLADLPALVRLAELLEGEATDRVELGEVQLVIQAVMAAAGRFVPRELRDEFLRELDAATAGLTLEASAA